MPSLADLPCVSVDDVHRGHTGVMDLWCYAPDVEEDDDPRTALEWTAREATLSPGERVRANGYRFARDRRTFIASRALLRSALSSYLLVPLDCWRFEADEHGRPHIAWPEQQPHLHFSLSHTDGLVACAISSRHSRLGVDVEPVNRSVDIDAIARDHFAPEEVRDLDALTGTERQRRFIEYWTLKESYAKGHGLGLAFPFNRCSFDVSRADAGVRCVDARVSDADGWQFALIDAAPRHVIAIAVDTGGASLRLRAAFVSPFHRPAVDHQGS